MPLTVPALRSLRLMLLGLVLIGGALAGCQEQRSDNNPFIGPSGAALESPYGDGITAVPPDAGGTRP